MLLEVIGPLLAWLGFNFYHHRAREQERIDPFSELHFMVLVEGGDQLESVRQLVGSIHAHRRGRLPVIHLFSRGLNRMAWREMALWEGVRHATFEQAGAEQGELLAARLAWDHGMAIWIKTKDVVFAPGHFSELWARLQQHGSFEGSNFLALVRDDPRFYGWLRLHFPAMVRGMKVEPRTLSQVSDSFGLIPTTEAEQDYRCAVSIKPEAMYAIAHSQTMPETSPALCLGIATTGRGVGKIEDHPLLRFTLGTLHASLNSTETMDIYVGYDEGDWVTERAMLMAERLAAPFRIHWLRFPASPLGAVTLVWNGLLVRAMQGGCQYFYQLNDDVTFVSAGWATAMLSQFQKDERVKVVGPNDRYFDCRLMTQVMVSREHWQRYGFLFPPEILNWHCDTWISGLYGKVGTRCLRNIWIENRRDPTEKGRRARYRPCPKVDHRGLIDYYKPEQA